MNKAIIPLVVLFFGFWLFKDPTGLADTVTSSLGWVWNGVQDLFNNLIDFVDAL